MPRKFEGPEGPGEALRPRPDGFLFFGKSDCAGGERLLRSRALKVKGGPRWHFVKRVVRTLEMRRFVRSAAPVKERQRRQQRSGAVNRRRPGSTKILQGSFVDRKSTRLNSSHQIISYAVF